MAQAEDTELRDLVVEALEKNGSLAKIRALLRANIFLVFEDDCENIKQNVNLDSILKLPEGIFCLSIIHEFLEYCNLKNTLFVYMSESRQGKEYSYEGRNSLLEKFKLSKRHSTKEPILVTLIKNVLQQQAKSFGLNEKHVKRSENNFKDEQNNTYIVHEDSTTSISHSNSDNSSDEKNKLHLRLQLDNSDTDTSSDSTRGKTSSEYIPSDHILTSNQSPRNNSFSKEPDRSHNLQNTTISIHGPEINKNSSNSDSTSYVEIKPLSPLDKILFNTTGVPFAETKTISEPIKLHSTQLQSDIQAHSPKSTNTNHFNSDVIKNDKQKSDGSTNDFTEYSLDFTSPPSGKKESVSRDIQSSQSIHDQLIQSSPHLILQHENYDQKSITSPSSISTSEAADIISDKSSYSLHKSIEKNITRSSKSKSISNYSKKRFHDSIKLLDDDSGDFSDSPIPSLSNLSLDIHSE